MSKTPPFNSHLVLEEKISESTFRAYHVGFEQNKFRLQHLVQVIRAVIPEFALGYYGGNFPPGETLDKLNEAALTVYDTDKYQKRGEFGELILHLLLRDFLNSIPLISKISFKDSVNCAVHGFDGVHVVEKDGRKKLWLGESKLYKCGKDGVKDLVKDLKNHIQNDYLRKEFMLLTRKLPQQAPDIQAWRDLMNSKQSLDTIFDGICIPLVCTYSSDLFKKHNNATQQYIDDFIAECNGLRDLVRDDISTSVDVMLMLLPVPCKDELNSELHKRLKAMQQV